MRNGHQRDHHRHPASWRQRVVCLCRDMHSDSDSCIKSPILNRHTSVRVDLDREALCQSSADCYSFAGRRFRFDFSIATKMAHLSYFQFMGAFRRHAVFISQPAAFRYHEVEAAFAQILSTRYIPSRSKLLAVEIERMFSFRIRHYSGI
eukprot:gene19153-22559_t